MIFHISNKKRKKMKVFNHDYSKNIELYGLNKAFDLLLMTHGISPKEITLTRDEDKEHLLKSITKYYVIRKYDGKENIVMIYHPYTYGYHRNYTVYQRYTYLIVYGCLLRFKDFHSDEYTTFTNYVAKGDKLQKGTLIHHGVNNTEMRLSTVYGFVQLNAIDITIPAEENRFCTVRKISEVPKK